MAKKVIKEHLGHFNVAGFSYYDGAEAFPELHIGLEVDLSLDPDNRFDPKAVMISYKNYKLGYIPKQENDIFWKLLKTGVTNMVARVQRLCAEDHPEQQIWVVVHLVG